VRALGAYLLSSRLATGALGEAYLAGRADDDTGEALWVKVLRPELSSNLRIRRVLQMEAGVATTFRHPHAVRLLEIGFEGDDTFFVAPLFRGQPLSVLLRRAQVEGAPLGQPLVCWIALQVAQALAAAHAVPWFEGAPGPLVHGAVSPRAILVGYDGRVALSGLGIGRARALVPAAGPRLPYVAPELLNGKEPTIRTDVYGLGITLHDALGGRAVYRRPDEVGTRAAILAGNAPPLPPRLLTVRPEVGDAIQRMMLPRVDARTADLAELTALLAEAAGGDDHAHRAALAAHLAALFREERQGLERQLGVVIRASGGTGDLPPPEATPADALDEDHPAEAAVLTPPGASPPAERPADPLDDLPLEAAVLTPPAAPPPAERPADPLDDLPLEVGVLVAEGELEPEPEAWAPPEAVEVELDLDAPGEEDDLDIEVVEGTPPPELRMAPVRPRPLPPPLEPAAPPNPFAAAVLGRPHSPRPRPAPPPPPPQAAPPVRADDPERPFVGLLSQSGHVEPDAAVALEPEHPDHPEAALEAGISGAAYRATVAEVAPPPPPPPPEAPRPPPSPLALEPEPEDAPPDPGPQAPRPRAGSPRLPPPPPPRDPSPEVSAAPPRPPPSPLVLEPEPDGVEGAGAPAPGPTAAQASAPSPLVLEPEPEGVEAAGATAAQAGAAPSPLVLEPEPDGVEVAGAPAPGPTAAAGEAAAEAQAPSAPPAEPSTSASAPLWDPELPTPPQGTARVGPEDEAEVELDLTPPAAFSERPGPAPGRPGRVGRYRLLHPVPTSQPRQRHLARDPSLSRDVWLDVLALREAVDPRLPPEAWVERFKLEARLLAQVAHPRLPAVLDAGRDGERVFTARAPVMGGPLAPAGGPPLGRWTPEAAVPVIRGLAEALDALHQADLRAGGLLPEDVWLDEAGRAVLADLPRLFPAGGPEHPLVAPTLAVLPPEFMDGAPFGRAGDLFSLGLLAGRLLTGADLLPATPEARIAALRAGHVPVPEVADPNLQDILRRLLAPVPGLRVASAREVVEALGAAVPEGPAAGAPEGAADVVLVDPDVTPGAVRRILQERGIRAAVFPTVDAALTELPSLGARSLVVARAPRMDEAEVRRRIGKVGCKVEVRFVPPAATRLVGPPLSLEGLVEAWLTLAPRVLALATPEAGFFPTSAARAMAAHLELGLRTELLAGLAAAARLLGRRLGESPLQLGLALPEEVPPVLEAVARIDAGTLSLADARPAARLVAVADAFYRATRLDGVAPSRALEQLKSTFTCRAGRATVGALIVHLRELYSTGDLAPPAADAPRVVLARRGRSPALVKMLEFDGLQVDEAEDGDEAWDLVRTLRPRVVVADDRLPGRDGITLAELCRVHPALAGVRFIVLGDPDDPELRGRVGALADVHLVDRGASVEALRARVGAVLA
jgi:serine/threonine protein kinase/CheY-like chemotaxis protein